MTGELCTRYILTHYLIQNFKRFSIKLIIWDLCILMKNWWNVNFQKQKCALFVLKPMKLWHTFFLLLCTCSSLMASVSTMFKTKCGITIDVTPETCILGRPSGDHFNIIDTCIIIKNTLYLLVNYKIQQQFSRNVWNRLSIIRN